MRTAEATASLRNPLTFVAGHGALLGYRELGWPARSCIFVHAAGQTHRYSAAPVSSEAKTRYACDCSYISNASGTPEQFLANGEPSWHGAGERIVSLYRDLGRRIIDASERGAMVSLDEVGQALTQEIQERGVTLRPDWALEMQMMLTRLRIGPIAMRRCIGSAAGAVKMVAH